MNLATQWLNAMSLIPEGGAQIVDKNLALQKERVLAVVTPRATSKAQSIQIIPRPPADEPVQGPRKSIMLPRFRPQSRVLRVIRNNTNADLSVPSGFHLDQVGRWSEIWSNDESMQMAIVRRADRRILIFDQAAHINAINYIYEAQRRGVTLVQATDIVCNELSQ